MFLAVVGYMFNGDDEGDDPDCQNSRDLEENGCFQVEYTGSCWFWFGTCQYSYWDENSTGGPVGIKDNSKEENEVNP